MLINHIEIADSDTHFAPRCFDNTIGKEVPVRAGDKHIGTGRITAVKVSPDGGSAKFSIELPGSTEQLWTEILPKGYTELNIDVPAVDQT